MYYNSEYCDIVGRTAEANYAPPPQKHSYMDASVEEVRNRINAMAIKFFLVICVIFCSVISHTSIICVHIVSVLSIVCWVASSYSLYYP